MTDHTPLDEHGNPKGFFERTHYPASTEGRRYRLFRLFFHHDTREERNFDLALIITILASVLVVMLDSVPGIKARWHDQLYIAEWFFTLLFTAEYLVRMWVVRRPARYAGSFFGVIDLLAILPTFLSLLFPASASLAVVRILRLLRIFRILKLVEYSSEAGLLIQSLLRSRRKIFLFICTILTITVVFGSLMYVIEGPAHGFHSIPTGMYWAVVTMATVGYGDISPGTPLGRFFTSALVIIGYSIIAVPTGIYTAELARSLREKSRTNVRCKECGLPDHESDAWHCRKCGRALPHRDTDEDGAA
ncbi:ion transporter [Lysobacter pythonis]|uniref:Ion transporter n=1 Tax=Solilutibacter pythonis TaxID=2483112 RepID=A0A3M2HFJ6_9GAMM|nr:ion transporter [Lysobacter pythonis]RMH87728.1 ion transporter [Lysobacter pythonis]